MGRRAIRTTGGIGAVGPTGSAGTAAVAPGNVTIGAITVDPLRIAPAFKTRATSPPKRGVEFRYDPPVIIGTFEGVYLQIEAPDQSVTAPTPLDGSVALNGATGLGGPKEPLSFGPFAHSDTGGVIRVSIDEPAPLPMGCRVRMISYSANLVNDAAASPSATFTVDLENVAKRDSATAHTANAAISAPLASPDGSPNPFTAIEGGVLMTHLWVHQDAPADARYAGTQWIVKDASGSTIAASGVQAEADFELVFNTPTTVQDCIVYGCGAGTMRGAAGTAINPLVEGITPSVVVSLGTSTGTIHLGHAITDTIGPALAIIAGVLGVPTNGITEDLINTFAVSSGKIADGAIQTGKIALGAVTNPKIGNFAVDSAQIAAAAITNAKMGSLSVATANIQDAAITTVKIANLAVTNALIANAAITNAKIADLAADKITGGTIAAAITLTSPTLVITAGVITVTISATAVDGYPGIHIANTSTNQKMDINEGVIRIAPITGSYPFTLMSPGQIILVNSSGTSKTITATS